jgi:hypothetical protein
MSSIFIHKVKIIMKVSEHQEQVALVSWFRLAFPKFKIHLFAIPNGAHLAGDARLRAIKMNAMKSEGFTSGVSDLFLMIPKNGYHGLWIEMKAKAGKVSDNQKEFMAAANAMNYKTIVCFGFDDAKIKIEEYLK